MSYPSQNVPKFEMGHVPKFCTFFIAIIPKDGIRIYIYSGFPFVGNIDTEKLYCTNQNKYFSVLANSDLFLFGSTSRLGKTW